MLTSFVFCKILLDCGNSNRLARFCWTQAEKTTWDRVIKGQFSLQQNIFSLISSSIWPHRKWMIDKFWNILYWDVSKAIQMKFIMFMVLSTSSIHWMSQRAIGKYLFEKIKDVLKGWIDSRLETWQIHFLSQIICLLLLTEFTEVRSPPYGFNQCCVWENTLHRCVCVCVAQSLRHKDLQSDER